MLFIYNLVLHAGWTISCAWFVFSYDIFMKGFIHNWLFLTIAEGGKSFMKILTERAFKWFCTWEHEEVANIWQHSVNCPVSCQLTSLTSSFGFEWDTWEWERRPPISLEPKWERRRGRMTDGGSFEPDLSSLCHSSLAHRFPSLSILLLEIIFTIWLSSVRSSGDTFQIIQGGLTFNQPSSRHWCRPSFYHQQLSFHRPNHDY